MSKPLSEIYGPFRPKPTDPPDEVYITPTVDSAEHLDRVCSELQRKITEEEIRLQAERDKLSGCPSNKDSSSYTCPSEEVSAPYIKQEINDKIHSNRGPFPTIEDSISAINPLYNKLKSLPYEKEVSIDPQMKEDDAYAQFLDSKDQERLNVVHPVDSLFTKAARQKLDWTLLPFDALEEVVVAFQVGRDKHPGEDDWSCGLHSYRDMANGLLRHFNAWIQGEDNDPDGFLHMAGIAARALMLTALYLRHTPDVDDR